MEMVSDDSATWSIIIISIVVILFYLATRPCLSNQ